MTDSLNVKVALRVRPMNRLEKEENCKLIVRVENDKTVILSNPDVYADTKEYPFTFDHAYFWNCTQEQVYADLGVPLLEKALSGYNGTIFAYGQTGAGKTHSITGTPELPGIVPKMNKDIFERIAKDASKQYLVTVSYLELYNENIYDLLSANPSHADSLKVREHPKLGVYVEGLSELAVRDHLDIEKKMIEGNSQRHVAATKMNERSSRSHSVFTIKISQKDTNDTSPEFSSQSKINLVDLAGSERAGKTEAEGNTLKEAAMINTSLSALGNVINALADPKKKKSHVPFRSSKLTRLLQESLGGNTITIMLAALSPADRNFDETLNTLQYANRAKNIQNKSGKNTVSPAQLVKELKQQLEELQARILREQGNGDIIANPDSEGSQSAIASLSSSENQSSEEETKLTEKQSTEMWTSNAKNGILQFKIHYYRKMKNLGDAKLNELNQEIILLSKILEELLIEQGNYIAINEDNQKRKEELELYEKLLKERKSQQQQSILMENWKASIKATKALKDWFEKQTKEIEFLQTEMDKAQTLDARIELQAKEMDILLTELLTLQQRTKDLEVTLLLKTSELGTLISDMDSMLSNENTNIQDLQLKIMEQEKEILTLQDQNNTCLESFETEKKRLQQLQNDFQSLLLERAQQEKDHRKTIDDLMKQKVAVS
eukprot:TRINITY_DN17008_c0_g1_i1.p1 TRINITY_DN17008_c0_g1~~TRINITY_DN17008_c0_g1_i1.p1  ORF type:complete len:665 (+),score=165.94 TRINITY_DN17008_c0_g1_i1:1544-3538(+)